MKIVVFLLILALGAGVFVVVSGNMSEDENGAQQAEREVIVEQKTVEVVKEVEQAVVLVASKDLQIGKIIERSDLKEELWPRHLLLGSFVAKTDKNQDPALGLMGRIVRSSFSEGEPIITSKLANPEDPNFLAASLPAGKRAVTISIDAIRGVAGFIYPGDKVDVLITHRVDITDAGVKRNESDTRYRRTEPKPVSEILLENIKVLVVNQAASPTNNPEGTGPMIPSSVTLEVDREQAQKLRLASAGNGQLSLALRPLESVEPPSQSAMVKPTGKDDLTRLTPGSSFPYLAGSSQMFGNVQDEPDVANDNFNQTDVTIIRGINKEVVGVPYK